MLFAKKEFHNMDFIRTSSKDALKRSLMQMYQGDVTTMERMYDFYMKDMEKVPDFDPVPPSMMQQVKESVSSLFSWADANQDKIVGAYNMIQSVRSGQPLPMATGSAPAGIPPLPKIE